MTRRREPGERLCPWGTPPVAAGPRRRLPRPDALLAVWLACAGATAQAVGPAGSEPPSPGFVAVRGPVLGFTLEWNQNRGIHRLVRGDTGNPTVLVTGKLSACEELMLTLLEKEHGTGNINLALQTRGGRQLWADEFLFAGWRIQQNHFTGRFRLLDPDDIRRAWGSYEGCRVAFEKARIQQGLARPSDHLVVLVHGLGRTRHSFDKLAEELRAEGYEAAAVAYPSTRGSIAAHGAQLGRILARTDGIKTISFVTHSMGGLVVREMLSHEATWKDTMTVGRLVMLAPPNRGSVMAEKLKDVFPITVLAGEPVRDLVAQQIAKIPEPECVFGVIAGGTGRETGMNPLIDGDNDGMVSVQTTKLDGMADFLLVNSLHTLILTRPDVIAATKTFLQTGQFTK